MKKFTEEEMKQRKAIQASEYYFKNKEKIRRGTKERKLAKRKSMILALRKFEGLP